MTRTGGVFWTDAETDRLRLAAQVAAVNRERLKSFLHRMAAAMGRSVHSIRDKTERMGFWRCGVGWVLVGREESSDR